jgi:hypothetical protein
MNSLGTSSRSPRYTQQELLRAYLRNDLCGFVQKVFETVNPGVPFSRNWSTEAVTHALQKVASGATTRLIINIPPRNLKSICASVALPAFLLGHNPTKKIICVSYSDDLAAKFSNDCRAVMRTDWYQQTFPRARIDKAKDTESEVRTTERGYRLATSVGARSPAGAATSSLSTILSSRRTHNPNLSGTRPSNGMRTRSCPVSTTRSTAPSSS